MCASHAQFEKSKAAKMIFRMYFEIETKKEVLQKKYNRDGNRGRM